MTFSEVKQLLDAGFTKDEIMNLSSTPAEVPAAAPAEVPAEVPADVPAEVPEKVTVPSADPAEVPGPAEASSVSNETLDQLNETMHKLIRTIQLSNLQSAHTDNPTVENMTEKVDKIMASIIRPDK